MNDNDQLWGLEEQLWTGGLDSARHMSAKGAVFIFPYPIGILQGDGLWSHKAISRWRSVVMTNRVLTRESNVSVLAYRVSAEREGTPVYEALCASTYLLDDADWLRMSHQQTPCKGDLAIDGFL